MTPSPATPITEQEKTIMKLHTSLTDVQVSNALFRAQQAGRVTRDVHFAVFAPERSSTHPHGFQLQLGTDSRDSLPRGYKDQNGATMNVRRGYGASRGTTRYAATWHEWGWLIAEIFAADPGARWGANPARCARPEHAWGYASPAVFHAKTDDAFRFGPATPGTWTPPIRRVGSNLVIPIPAS
jgi:uncharacterized protein YwbE